MGDNKISTCFTKKIIKDIKLHKTDIAYGAEKQCHLFTNVVAFSQNVKGYSQQEIERKLLLSLIKKKNADRLIFCGVNTPKILNITLINDEILEVQERAIGNVLCYTNESNMLCKFGNIKEYYTCFKDMPDFYKKEIFDKIYKYNISMQKQLKDAPVSHYVKFLKDFKAIEEYGINLDVHGENFLYHSTDGFSFIDLPPIQSIENKNFDFNNISSDIRNSLKKLEKHKDVSDIRVVYKVISMLSDYLKFAGNAYTEKQIKLIKRNNKQIVNKILLASKINNFKINKNEVEHILKLSKHFVEASELKIEKTLV